VDHRNRTLGVRLIDQRANLFAAESVVFGDRYIFIRDAYLQRREYQVKDGQVEDDFDDF
jgi:phospholipid-binding lipoprotein MlaA